MFHHNEHKKKCKYESILYRGQYKGQAICEKVSSLE